MTVSEQGHPSKIAKATKSLMENGLYTNPWPTWTGLVSPLRFMKYLIFDRKKRIVPTKEQLDQELPVRQPDFTPPPNGRMKLTWIGHATVVAQFDGIAVMTDPIWSDRCSPIAYFGPRRCRPPPCRVDELPKLDIVVISHNHYDHLDSTTVKSLDARFGEGIQWYVPLGHKSWFRTCGIQNVSELDWWDELELSPAVRSEIEWAGASGSSMTGPGGPDAVKILVACVPVQHWSLRNGFDKFKTLWGGWVIKGPTQSFFFPGDTGYCPAFKEIGEKYGPFSAAALPIGCYSPRELMKQQHMDPDEAVQVHQDVDSAFSIGIHWGTFDMGAEEPFLEPPLRLKTAVENAKLKPGSFVTVDIGDSMEVPTTMVENAGL